MLIVGKKLSSMTSTKLHDIITLLLGDIISSQNTYEVLFGSLPSGVPAKVWSSA